MDTKNIMIVGVGGQGSLLASKLLGYLLLNEGYDVKVSEVHGMSQRGGSVVTYVRYGSRVASPVIDEGEADFIVSFELLEAARWLPFLKPDGQVVTNIQQIDPMPVVTGAMEYPEDLVRKMRDAGAKVDAMDCVALVTTRRERFSRLRSGEGLQIFQLENMNRAKASHFARSLTTAVFLSDLPCSNQTTLFCLSTCRFV